MQLGSQKSAPPGQERQPKRSSAVPQNQFLNSKHNLQPWLCRTHGLVVLVASNLTLNARPGSQGYAQEHCCEMRHAGCKLDWHNKQASKHEQESPNALRRPECRMAVKATGQRIPGSDVVRPASAVPPTSPTTGSPESTPEQAYLSNPVDPPTETPAFGTQPTFSSQSCPMACVFLCG